MHTTDLTADNGHVRHGYARTIHKTQGLSVDRCLVLASDTLDHHAGYTALSRGRIDNRIYLVEQPDIDLEAHHASRETTDPRRQLAAALQTDHADRLAIDHRVDVVRARAPISSVSTTERAQLARFNLPRRPTEPPTSLRSTVNATNCPGA